ncbi:efflux transporter outer membrane subunit [Pandoraea bronchicola]|uniref:Cation/multidrug efflux system outer membrane porin n=1 Tax=Pandoraea bronchicola TaxID=2508287 RepID=A0A5E5BTH6_9BURK|nr:efflux transporter outer membrane subunit [Pandoraea bronchicola]VVE88442.1 cation/multidrug efflux system outer membrane porin [Pandoraea bronchicola]
MADAVRRVRRALACGLRGAFSETSVPADGPMYAMAQPLNRQVLTVRSHAGTASAAGQGRGVATPARARRTATFLAASAVLWLAGCAVGPDYVRPDVDTPAAFKETGDWKLAEPSDAVSKGEWWAIYKDPVLSELMAQVDVNNQNIKIAEANYRQALAVASQARSAFFPTIGADAGLTRASSRVSSTAVSGSGVGGISNSYSLSGTASWEPDIWGSVRRSVEAGNASAEASAAELANARLSAQALLAQNYFDLRVTDAQRALLERTVAAYEQTLKLTQNQYAVGVAQRSDVIQAQTQLQSAQASAIDIEVTRAQLEHAIALLVGKAPAAFALTVAPLRAALPPVPVSLPSKLLERRPDIASAERSVAAANAKIGVAKAAFFPTLSLSATGGFQSSSFANWLTLPSRFWSVGPALAATLFDGGLRRAQTDAAIAAYDAQVATYRQTVLTAFQSVEDNLAALNYLGRESVVQNQAVQSSREALQLILNQYKAGTVSFQNVLTAQATAYTTERTALTILGRQFTANVLLVTALGGGWHGLPSEGANSVAQQAAATSDAASPANRGGTQE